MNPEKLKIWKSTAGKSDGLVRIYAEDLLAIIALAERTTSPVSQMADKPDTSQDWAKLDGATAFHLIERHAEDWAETGHMMESWLAARLAAAAPHAQVPAEQQERVHPVDLSKLRRYKAYEVSSHSDVFLAADVKQLIAAAPAAQPQSDESGLPG